MTRALRAACVIVGLAWAQSVLRLVHNEREANATRKAVKGVCADCVQARMTETVHLRKQLPIIYAREDQTMLSRRSFLKSTLGAGVALAGARLAPAAAQPTRQRMIVDAHVHMWKASTPERPWVPGASRSFRNHSPSRGWFP